MGESKRGEGRERSERAEQVAAAVGRTISAEGRQVDAVVVQHLTGDVWACEVQIHGEPEPERFFLNGGDVKPQ